MNTKRLLTLLALSVCCVLVTSGCSKQAKKQRHLKRADQYFQAKDFRKAEIEYLNTLRLDQTNATVIQRLATIYYDRGNLLKAAPFLMRARELTPDNTDMRVKLAQLYKAGGQFDKSRAEATYVLELDPTNDDALLILTETARTSKDVEEAHQSLLKLQPKAGNKAAWHLAMGALYLRQTNAPQGQAEFEKALALEPKSSRVQLAWGLFHAQKGDLKTAEQFIRTAAELAPDDASLKLRLVDLQFRVGATNEAAELLQQITKNAPDYTPAWIYRARAAAAAQNLDESMELVERILIQDPANYDARLLRANIKRTQGKAAEAIKELEELKRLYPQSSDLSLQLALAHLRNQDRTKAATHLQQALALNPNSPEAILLSAEMNLQKGDAASAASSLEQLIRKQPGASRAYFLLASAYSAQRKFDDAITLYSKLGANSPTNAAIPFLTGVTLRQQGRNAEARKSFEKALELAPGDLLVSYQLLELDLFEKNYAAASQRVEHLLQKNPKSAGAKFLEARVHLAQTNLTQAEAALQQTIEWDPNFVSAYDLLAKLHVTSKNLPEAIKNLEAILARNPKNIGSLMLMGAIYEQTSQLEKAAETYKTALKANPQSVAALNNLAYLLSEKMNNLAESYDYAVKARDLAPQQPNVADTLGWICFRRQEYPRALILLQESAVGLPNQPEVQFHLGMAQYMMGQEEAAAAVFKQSLQTETEFPGRTEASNCLALLTMDVSKAAPNTIAALQARIRQSPNDVPALLRLGKCHAKLGQTAQARDAFEQARKANPNSVPVLVELVQLYSADANNTPQALTLAREARKLAPDDPKIAHVLGRLALQLNDAQWAHSLLQESAAKDSADPELLVDLARAQYSVGRIDDARQTVNRALQAKTPFARAEETRLMLSFIGFYYSPVERLQAETQILDSFKRTPDALPVAMVAGLVHEQRGRVTEARNIYDQILAKTPDFAPARKQLAGLYTDHVGDQQKALDYATKAREVLTQDPELAKTLGKIAYRRKDYRNAVRFLNESSARLSNDAEILYFLGMSHYSLKEKEASKRALSQALALNLNGSLAADTKKTLAELEKM